MVKPIPAPYFLPAVAPATAADVKKEYSQIEPSLGQRIVNCVLKYLTAGIFYAVQNYRLNQALKRGDTKTASNALNWGANTHLSGRDIAHLLDTKMIDSVKFLIAQVGPDEDDAIENPHRLKGLAQEIISLRDDAGWGKERNQAMQKLVPYTAFPKTQIETRFLEDELFGIGEIPYLARVLAPHQS